MRVAIDISPLTSGNYLSHRVRGTGFYLNNLKESLLKYHADVEYEFFNIKEMFKNEPDVIHYPYFEPYFLTLPANVGKKSVVTVHDLTPLVFKNELPPGLKGKIKWLIQKKRLRQTGAIIADSNASKRDIVRFTQVDESKIHVVYLAASPIFKQISDDEEKRIIKKFNLPDNFVLYVGDVTWNKNLPGLIEAVNKTGFYLVIAGAAFANESFDRNNPWNKDLVKSQKLAKQNKKIISVGFVNNDDLLALYNAATIFVMPSFYEGFGLPVLEAMKSGCPVITTKRGSLPEVAGDAAFFVEPDDVDSIASGIKKVMGNAKLRKDLSRRGLEQAKKFSWHKTANETIEVYKSNIGNKNLLG